MTNKKLKLKQARYAQVKMQMDALSKEADELKGEITEEMVHQGVAKDETPYGTFSIQSRTTWTYSEKVQKMSDALKVEQINEQEKGIAKPKVSETLYYKASKL